eukprot:GHVU01183908.1.p1 GENE.GHVU01183908.1~~GHVU01183908.1.p1  ORF type:complete len:632 (+),score=60.07 GHVU01183908.1:7-1902(+)
MDSPLRTLTPIPPASVKYLYGWIGRMDAEQMLRCQGLVDAMFVVRETTAPVGSYRITVAFRQLIHHYNIEPNTDGSFSIPTGKKFPGPIELVQHHQKYRDGMVCVLRIPCERPVDVSPWAWPYVTYAALEREILLKADELRLEGEKLANALGPQRKTLVAMISKDFHLRQPWYHGAICREEAELLIEDSGHEDGKFLVREKDPDRLYALSISLNGGFIHYLLDKRGAECYAIETGTMFKTMMDMIGSLHNNKEGLQTRLTMPCYRIDWPEMEREIIAKAREGMNTAYGAFQPATPDIIPGPPPDTGNRNSYIAPTSTFRMQMNPNVSETSTVTLSNIDHEKLYGTVGREPEVFNVSEKDLTLGEVLGDGNFGTVRKGFYKKRFKNVPVAIKSIKREQFEGHDVTQAEEELMKEARIMSQLKHKGILRLIGVCKAESIMLVLELAPLGQMNEYLKTHRGTSPNVILDLLYQVANGMAYLETMNFVHRDLAARNVLLVNATFAKISDFGMSKALKLDSNYYKSEGNGKWPLKWYAPECIQFFKFDSKSDVWSYGVTMWEAFSYGAKPYKHMTGVDILTLLQQGGRMCRPDVCTPAVYTIMLSCWEYEKENRPTFKVLLERLNAVKNRKSVRES